MFVNCSNHPSSKWDELQTLSVRDDIVDIPFPNVDPHFSSAEVDEMAEDLCNKILQHKPYTVMIQGEATLVYKVVSLLKQRGVRVVAATSERRVTETVDPNGQTIKKVIFNFVQFREY